MRGAPNATQAREVLVDHASPDGPMVQRVRGTLLAASLQGLKDVGLYDSYLTKLPDAYRESILYSVATSWLPIEHALAHYQTCEQLGASDELIEELAGRVGKRLGQTFMANVLRLVRQTGSDTSWMMLKQTDRVWDRVFAGGGYRVTCLGPKDALLEFMGLPLVQCRYYRVAHAANIRGLVTLFAKKCYVRPVRPELPSPSSLALQLSWV